VRDDEIGRFLPAAVAEAPTPSRRNSYISADAIGRICPKPVVRQDARSERENRF